MKRCCVLGVTGSIGVQTVDVCTAHPEAFQITSISAGRNIPQLKKTDRAAAAVKSGLRAGGSGLPAPGSGIS